MINVTKRDALKAKSLPPGWQYVLVENHSIKPSNTDGSNVHYYELVIIDGQHKDTPLQDYMISEKAVGMGKNFFIGCGQPKEQWEAAEKGEAFSFDEKLPVGKVVKAMVTPEKFGNRTLNKATDFMLNDKPDLVGVTPSS
jgi:hypothetical protein